MEYRVGEYIETPQGGVLSITSLHRKEGRRYCKVICSICHQDAELFKVPIEVNFRNLCKGSVCCGCSTNTQWTEYQNTIRVTRMAQIKGLKFKGFYEDYKGSKTKLNLACPVHGSFSGMQLANFLNTDTTKYGCTICSLAKRNKKTRSPDKVMIEHFKDTGKFTTHTFERVLNTRDITGGYSLWDVTCSICSSDKFAQNGCKKVFRSTASHLREGKVPCRCSSSYRWSAQERYVQILSICKEESLTFVKFNTKTDTIKNYDTLTWLCREGHTCEDTTITKFVQGSRCNVCRKMAGYCNGFYKTRKYEKDYIYLLDLQHSGKIGRTFTVQTRLSYIRRKEPSANVVALFQGCHAEVYTVEQEILKMLEELGVRKTLSWTTEAFNSKILSEVLEYLHNSNLTEVL